MTWNGVLSPHDDVSTGDYMNFQELIAKAKEKAGLENDNQLAQRLGVTRSIVSAWQNDIRAPGAEAAIKLATLAGEEPMTAIAVCELARERNPESRAFWQRIAKGENWRKRCHLSLQIIRASFLRKTTAARCYEALERGKRHVLRPTGSRCIHLRTVATYRRPSDSARRSAPHPSA